MALPRGGGLPLISHPTVVLSGYFCFLFLTALLTAGGRMDTGDPRFTAVLESIGPVRPEARGAGTIVRAIPVESGFQLSGWAEPPWGKAPSAFLVFTDEAGKVIGFGRQFRAGLRLVLASRDIPSSLAWVGFVFGTRAG